MRVNHAKCDGCGKSQDFTKDSDFDCPMMWFSIRRQVPNSPTTTEWFACSLDCLERAASNIKRPKQPSVAMDPDRVHGFQSP